MKITKRQLKRIIREEYTRILKESIAGNQPIMTDADINSLNKIWRLAQDGYKLIVRGQRGSLYTGIGNRQGLHGYAATLAREKWARGQNSLIRKLKKLQVGDVIQEKQGSREIYDTAKWTPGLFDFLQSVSSPADVESLFSGGW